MKYLLIIIFLPISSVSIIFQNEIKWTPDTKLKWSDFKKKLEKGTKEYATLTGGIDYNVKQESDNTILATVFAFYDKKESGKVEDSKVLTEEILRHEQGHFDIWEWYARIVRKKLIDSILTKFNQVALIINRTYKEAREKQDQYDKETYLTDKGTSQHRWDSLIASKLKEYSAYSNTELRIHLRKK